MVRSIWCNDCGAYVRRFLPDKIVLVCNGKRIALPGGTEDGIFLSNASYGGGGSKVWHNDAESDIEYPDLGSETNDDEQSRASSVGSTDASTHFGLSSPHDELLDIVLVHGTLASGQM